MWSIMNARVACPALSLLSILLISLTPTPASACWDGFSAELGKVSIEGEVHPESEPEWQIGQARALARWGTRLNALLPHDSSLDIAFLSVTLCVPRHRHKCAEIPAPWWKEAGDASPAQLDHWLGRAFALVATRIRATPRRIAVARRASSTLFTVQVGSYRSRGLAERQVEQLNHMVRYNYLPWESRSFYVAGGFPALDDVAHLLPCRIKGHVWHRVVVGEFTSLKNAMSYRAAIERSGTRAAIIASRLR